MEMVTKRGAFDLKPTTNSPQLVDLNQNGKTTIQSSMAPRSFVGLPLELRLQVYSYLLDSKNVEILATKAKPDRISCWRREYQTSLFYVCKQIAGEALDYFYSVNAFVHIAAHQNLIEAIGIAVPVTFWHHKAKFLHWAMFICYEQSDYMSGRKKSVTVAARDLASLRLLIHATQMSKYHNNQVNDRNWVTSISASIRSRNGRFKGTLKAKQIIMRNLKDFQQLSTNTIRCKFPSNITEAEKHTITNSEKWSRSDYTGNLARAQAMKFEGDKFYSMQSYKAATLQYKGAGDFAALFPRDVHNSYTIPMIELLIDSCVLISMTQSNMERPVTAFRTALQAYYYARRSHLLPGGGFSIQRLEAICSRIKVRLNIVLANWDDMEQAANDIRKELNRTPDAWLEQKLRECNYRIGDSWRVQYA